MPPALFVFAHQLTATRLLSFFGDLCESLQAMHWQFDVSSFLVLLGEEEESNFRLIRRRGFDIFATAPVAGFQSYLWSESKVLEAHGPEYISPYGGKVAPLRNMRIKRMLSLNGMLQDGAVTTYRISNHKRSSSFAQNVANSGLSIFMAIFTWISYATLLFLACTLSSITWIGIMNLAALVGWSLVLRMIDRFVFVPGDHKPSHADRPDAVVFMGRRHSALILEGSRADIARWTGSGLRLRGSCLATLLHYVSRFGTVVFLIMVFCTVPNGSTQDQILFIACNVLGQVNTWAGQRLHAKQTFRKLDLVEQYLAPSRTHVYASLIKRFGNGRWVETASLVPDTKPWDLWREQIGTSHMDPKQLWEKCEADHASPEKHAANSAAPLRSSPLRMQK